MADEHERLLAQRDDFELGILDRIRNEAEIHHVAEHVVINLVGAAILDVDVHRRVAPHEPFDIRRQIVQADGINRGDPDRAGNDVLQLLNLAVERFISLNDLLAVIVKHLAFTCEAEFLFAAFNQQRFERAFQRADLLADRRLGDAVDLGGLGETFGFGQVAKNFQAFNLHKRS